MPSNSWRHTAVLDRNNAPQSPQGALLPLSTLHPLSWRVQMKSHFPLFTSSPSQKRAWISKMLRFKQNSNCTTTCLHNFVVKSIRNVAELHPPSHMIKIRLLLCSSSCVHYSCTQTSMHGYAYKKKITGMQYQPSVVRIPSDFLHCHQYQVQFFKKFSFQAEFFLITHGIEIHFESLHSIPGFLSNNISYII